MKMLLTLLAACFLIMQANAQQKTKLSICMSSQYNQTIYDRTSGNNPWSAGFGAQAFLQTGKKFVPMTDITADAYLADDKVLRLSKTGIPVSDANGVLNIFAGVQYQASNFFYLSFSAGPSFINSNSYLGVKSSAGFYFSKSQKVTGRFFYTNIFNREYNYEETKKLDFGSLGISIGITLF
jgi:hypothetical protein